jgi:predicted unusual protein kinase regulating ubiquinone biosynthesis (AarF/ABC1/UbiB family)
MGQVHGATTLDGRDVVVKIQFPGIDKAIESDLRNVALLARSLSFAGNLLDGRGYAEEIAATLRRELDYKEEIRQLEQFRTAAAPWPELVIPQPLPELSTTRVLVLERLRGPTMLQVAQDPETPADVRLRVSSQLVTATWGPFLRARLVHADPHPGNYIVLPDGRLGVLDFGATKVLSVPFTLAYWQILDACMHGEPMDLTAILSSAGFEIQGEPERLARYLQDLARIIERPLRDVDYDWAACRITPDVRDLTQRNALTALRCRAPDESLSFYRAAAGVAGDLRMLRSRGDFQSVMAQLMATARAHLEPELVSATHRRLPV